MAVLKNKTKRENFLVVSKIFLQDQNLSLNERGLLATMHSLPDDWDFSIAGMRKILPDGETKIKSALDGLINKGYISKKQSKCSNGRFGKNIIEVNESPLQEKPLTVKAKMEIPFMERTLMDNPIEENLIKEIPLAENMLLEKPIKDFLKTEKLILDNSSIDNLITSKTSAINAEQYNNNKYNNKQCSNNKSINQIDEIDGTIEAENLKVLVAENIKLKWLLEIADKHGEHEISMVNEIYNVICDMVCFKREYVVVKDTRYPWENVKSQFLKLKYEHVCSVLNRIVDSDLGIKNMSAYLISTLYTESLVGIIENEANLYDEYLKKLRGKPY